VIPGPILEWLGHAVLESDRTERATLDQAIQRLRAQYDRIEARIETMYMDKLDGRVTQQFFDRNSAMWRDQQDALLRKVRDIQTAAPAPIDQAIDILQLTSRASELFFQQPAAEQRRLLQVVVEKATWQHRTLQTTLFEPFEVLRHSNRESCRKEKENAGSGRDLEVWLPRQPRRTRLRRVFTALQKNTGRHLSLDHGMLSSSGGSFELTGMLLISEEVLVSWSDRVR
jgi:site-specific DNA recombinase